jgi:hypothetical protein
MRKAIKTSVRTRDDGSYHARIRWCDGSVTKGMGWSRSESVWNAERRKVRRISRIDP